MHSAEQSLAIVFKLRKRLMMKMRSQKIFARTISEGDAVSACPAERRVHGASEHFQHSYTSTEIVSMDSGPPALNPPKTKLMV